VGEETARLADLGRCCVSELEQLRETVGFYLPWLIAAGPLPAWFQSADNWNIACSLTVFLSSRLVRLQLVRRITSYRADWFLALLDAARRTTSDRLANLRPSCYFSRRR
jgi:hypothetical protein